VLHRVRGPAQRRGRLHRRRCGGGALGTAASVASAATALRLLASAVAGFAQGAVASAIAAGAIGAHVDSERDLRQLSRVSFQLQSCVLVTLVPHREFTSA
jgi:hypothetical protein